MSGLSPFPTMIFLFLPLGLLLQFGEVGFHSGNVLFHRGKTGVLRLIQHGKKLFLFGAEFFQLLRQLRNAAGEIPVLHDIEHRRRFFLDKERVPCFAFFFDLSSNPGITLQLWLHDVKGLCQPALTCQNVAELVLDVNDTIRMYIWRCGQKVGPDIG